VQGESTETAGGALEELAAGKRVHGVVEGWSAAKSNGGMKDERMVRELGWQDSA
jgi:hypothetical protein